MDSEELERIARTDEDQQLILYLRERCMVLNVEIRARDAKIAELETPSKFKFEDKEQE